MAHFTFARSILGGCLLASTLLWSACQDAEDPSSADPSGDKTVSPGKPRFVTGEFGRLDQANEAMIRASARDILHGLLVSEFRGAGDALMTPGKVLTDKSGGIHVRFTQQINGMVLEGAGMVIHARPDGTVFGANGDFVEVSGLPTTPKLAAAAAVTAALLDANITNDQLTQPALTYVLGTDGNAHLAWRATVDYTTGDDPQRDVIFADAETGKLVARHPQYHYGRALQTINANNSTSSRKWVTVSTSSGTINTGDAAIDSAHNYAIATYDYYLNNHGRDSIDNAGMTLVSRAHWGRSYNNAYWDGSQMTYGDGDGIVFVPLSQDADVVAHELTHGVTERSSGLIYQNESGALNEAWSDIFGALVDRQEGATGADIWLLGEDIYTPGTPGDGLRDMANPQAMGDYDWYPTRYLGTSDSGGVHTNSGIANLAFVLLVDGGTHPRAGAPSDPANVASAAIPEIAVTGIGFEAAADLFYAANVGCLTPGATFAEARFCTAEALAGVHAAAVHLAWDAVGVPTEFTPPPPPAPSIALADGVTLAGQDSNASTYQFYTLDVVAGSTVKCTTAASNGDADLYLRFGENPDADPNSTTNECGSYTTTSNESCTTKSAATSDTTLNALVHAYSPYTSLSITCTSTVAGACSSKGDSCQDSPCCAPFVCGGRPGNRVCK